MLPAVRYPVLALALTSTLIAHAQSVPEQIVVTATRSALPAKEVIADISLIDRAEIERSGAASVADLLASVPGLSLSRNGGPAATTSIYTRGAEGRFTAVLIDGVRIDSQATGGATWNAIPVSQIERIEVLRGPAAALYGSDALAGVVHIITRKGEAGFIPTIKLAAASYGTSEFAAGARGGEGKLSYAFNLASERSKGFNAVMGGNPDRDGYRNESVSGNLSYQFNQSQKLDLNLLDAKQKAAFDGFLPGQDDQSLHRLSTLGLHWQAAWSPVWRSQLALTSGTDRYESPTDFYMTKTAVNTLHLRNEINLGASKVNLDVEQREDKLRNDYTLSPNNKHRQTGVALGYAFNSAINQLQVNGRYDRDNEFGSHLTGLLAYGVQLGSGWQAVASAGSAFRTPTLFQRFSSYGTSDLKAETGRNVEASLRYQSKDLNASLTGYRNTVENLINYVGGPGKCLNGTGDWAGCYVNTGHARMSGLTATGSVKLGWLNVRANFDQLNAVNTDNGKQLARRPKQQAKLAADTQWDVYTTGAELRYVGSRFDDVANTVKLPAHTLVNLFAQASIAKDWRVLARIDNVANKSYESVSGYYSAGRTFYLGVVWGK